MTKAMHAQPDKCIDCINTMLCAVRTTNRYMLQPYHTSMTLAHPEASCHSLLISA